MPTVASGGINETKIKFDFCPLWDDFGKVAIFYCNEDAVYNVVINNNEYAVKTKTELNNLLRLPF